MTMNDYGSILDLPEPMRSISLARMGMTAEEFEAHQAGIWAELMARQARFEAGRESASTWQNDEDGSAQPVVVTDWPARG
jgi:hypothetical protein